VQHFRARVLVASAFVLSAFAILVGRLAWLQVVKHEPTARRPRRTGSPSCRSRRPRLIKDRNGAIIARNYSAYTLEVTPSKVENLEQTIDELAKVVDIQPRDRRRFKKLLEETKRFDSIPIRTRLSDEDVARFTANRFRFPGVELRARLFRDYPLGEIGSHNDRLHRRISPARPRARREARRSARRSRDLQRDGTHRQGRRRAELRERTARHAGRRRGRDHGGRARGPHLVAQAFVPGQQPGAVVDIELQKIVERAFGDRRGALIAIEPSSGDILAFVSKPTFDPNLFVDASTRSPGTS